MKIGVIGLGGRASGMLGLILGLDMGAQVTAVCDINPEQARERLLGLKGANPDEVHFYSRAEEMLDKEPLDGVMIGTRCSLHAGFAVQVLERNIPLFLEKPIATNMEDLRKLRDAGNKTSAKTVVSFPLRVTPLARLAREIIESGRIGTVEHVQGYNNVPYGGVYYHSWYRDENETQGLFLQKATHDFDYINHILGLKPEVVSAMTGKRIFKGDRPAGLKCTDCAEQNTCPEGPFAMKYIKGEEIRGEYCCFATDTGNEDCGSALVRYENGVHLAYSQNFFARKGAGTRGARFIGYKGTLEFDWYTDELKVFLHDTPRTEIHKLDSANLPHGGGDLMLALNFLDIIQGREESVAPLSAGIESALLCLKAKESAATDRFVPVKFD